MFALCLVCKKRWKTTLVGRTCGDDGCTGKIVRRENHPDVAEPGKTVTCPGCKSEVVAYMTCSECKEDYCDKCDLNHDVFHNAKEKEAVDHPDHYGGKDNLYEAIKIMKATMSDEEFRGFCKGSAIKYLVRAGKKDPEKIVEDYNKAAWYLRYYTGEIE